MSFLVVCAMVFSFMPITVHATDDTIAPKISCIMFSANAMTVNGGITTNINATDDLSTISSIVLTFKAKSGTATFNVTDNSLTFDASGWCNIPITVQATQSLGEYYLDVVSITDSSNNTRKYQYQSTNSLLIDSDNTGFQLSDTIWLVDTKDATAPVATSLLLNSSNSATVDKGSTVSISLGFTEVGSGLAKVDVTLINTTSPSAPNLFVSKKISPAQTTGTVILSLDIPKTTKSGTYEVSAVNMTDLFNNVTYYNVNNNQLVSNDGTVLASTVPTLIVNSSDDEVAPTIESIKAITDKMETNDVAEIQLGITEEGTGINSIFIETTKPSETAPSMNFNWNSSSGSTQKSGTVTLNCVSTSAYTVGTYKISKITIQDLSGNTSVYSSTEEAGTISLSTFTQTDPNALDIVVQNEKLPTSITSSLSSSTLLNDVAGMADSTVAKITGDTNVIPSQLISEIKNTNKRLEISKNGVTLIICGSSIDDTYVTISDMYITDMALTTVSGTPYQNSANVVHAVISNSTISFPGRCKVSVSNDYLTQISKLSTFNVYERDNLRQLNEYNIKSDNSVEINVMYLTAYFFSNGQLTQSTTTPTDTSNSPKVTKVAFSESSVAQDQTVDALVDVSTANGRGISEIRITLTYNQLDYISNRVDFTSQSYDATIHIPLTLKKHQKGGDYYIESVDITDGQGASRHYSYDLNKKQLIDSSDNSVAVNSITTLNVPIEPNADDVAPVITNVTIEKTSAAKGTSVNIQFTVVETGSGVTNLQIYFTNKEHPVHNGGLFAYGDYSKNPLKSGTYTISMDIPHDVSIGLNTYDNIQITDGYGNTKNYSSTDLKGIADDTLTVLTDGDDSAPVLTNVKVITDKVARPNYAFVQVNYSDTGYGIQRISGVFVSSTNESISVWYQTNTANSEISTTSGTITFQAQIQETQSLGEYKLQSIYIKDWSGNVTEYGAGGADVNSILDHYLSTITVVNENDDVSFTSLNNPNLVSFVTNQTNSAIIKIAADKQIAPAELFKAILGTNKTIDIYKNGVSWVFKATDLKESQIKDVDISSKLEVVRDYVNNGADNVVKLTFPENGLLPGRVTMRFKADYLSYLYNLKNGLRLYFDDNSELKQEATTFKMADDGYLEFTLLHNSTYFISNHRMTATPVVVPATDPSTTNPVYALSNTNLAEDITKLKDDAVIDVTVDRGTVTKDVFAALAGTKKEIKLHMDNVDWVFKGEDIDPNNLKDIRLDLSINIKDGKEFGSTEKVVLLTFPDNGLLPGNATIRIKSDDIKALYDTGKKLLLYYVDDAGNQTLIDSPITLSSDGYFEITVNHNSSYIIKVQDTESGVDDYTAPDTSVKNEPSDNGFALFIGMLVVVGGCYKLISKKELN